MDLRFGVKIYDNDWFLRHRLTPEQAADLLAAWGVTYVIAQSKFLPMSDSAVTSAVSVDERATYDALDDVAFRALLGERGITYFACLNICFDPAFFAAHPDLAGIDQFGRPIAQEDWYVGIPPDREANLDHKIGLLRGAVAALKPEAIHLGFIRWPGFWETWLPGDDRRDKPEYCFSARTVSAFNAQTGLDVPTGSAASSARVIEQEHRDAWTAWKCRTTENAIARIRRELEPIKSGLQYSINTLPFFRADFGNAVEEVFGQDVARLAAVVDVFEVMAYHQILRRPPSWPAEVAADIKSRSGRRAICTLQGAPLYLTGMHAGRGRQMEITATDFRKALDALSSTDVDGVCVFTFGDLLNAREAARGQEMLAALRSFRR